MNRGRKEDRVATGYNWRGPSRRARSKQPRREHAGSRTCAVCAPAAPSCSFTTAAHLRGRDTQRTTLSWARRYPNVYKVRAAQLGRDEMSCTTGQFEVRRQSSQVLPPPAPPRPFKKAECRHESQREQAGAAPYNEVAHTSLLLYEKRRGAHGGCPPQIALDGVRLAPYTNVRTNVRGHNQAVA